eukprot:tig00020816_g14113.t1
MLRTASQSTAAPAPLEPACTRETCRVPACTSSTGLDEAAAIARLRARAGASAPGSNAKRSLYEDPTFPASLKSLFRDPEKPWEGHADVSLVEWLRPGELCPGQPRLFVDGAQPGDVIQGNLADCWLLGAFSVLASRPQLLERVFASPRHAARGLYAVAIYKDHHWHRILIDDRIPCLPGPRPLYASCRDPNEIWVPLLEKAFAKAHGCYENLVAGYVDHGLKDLTGGLPQTVPLAGAGDKLWRILQRVLAEGSLAGCACALSKGARPEEANEKGILKGHAYGVLEARVVTAGGTPHRLLRVRNPWGRAEWKGPWSDGAPEWSEEILAELGYEFGDDGTFWIGWEDFTKEFTTLYLCRIFGEGWAGQRILGEWKAGWSAWGCPNAGNRNWHRNRQFHLQIEGRALLHAVLSQGDVRLLGRSQREYPAAIGFFVFRAGGAGRGEPVAAVAGNDDVAATSGAFKPSRDVSASFTLSEGNYKVVPMTYEPGQEAGYSLAIWSQGDVDLEDATGLPKFVRADPPGEARAGGWAGEHAGRPRDAAREGLFGASPALIRLAPPDEPEVEPNPVFDPRLLPPPSRSPGWLAEARPPEAPPSRAAAPDWDPPPARPGARGHAPASRPPLPSCGARPFGSEAGEDSDDQGEAGWEGVYERRAVPSHWRLSGSQESRRGRPRLGGRVLVSELRLRGAVPLPAGADPGPGWANFVWLEASVGERSRAARAALAPGDPGTAAAFADSFYLCAPARPSRLRLRAGRRRPRPARAELLGELRLPLADLAGWRDGAERSAASRWFPLAVQMALRYSGPPPRRRPPGSFPEPEPEPEAGAERVPRATFGRDGADWLEYTDKWGESREDCPPPPPPPPRGTARGRGLRPDLSAPPPATYPVPYPAPYPPPMHPHPYSYSYAYPGPPVPYLLAAPVPWISALPPPAPPPPSWPYAYPR